MPGLLLAENVPIIDLDSTIFLQLGVFILTGLLLSRFLFRPYLAVNQARAEGIEGARAAARRMDEEAQAKMGEYAQAFNTARAKANSERAKLQGEAVERERALIEAARKTIAETVDKARVQIAADAEVARVQLQPRARDIARDIAKKILGREVAW